MECNGNIGVARRCATHPQGRRQGNPGRGKAAVPVSARILACSFLPMSMPVYAFGAGTGTFSDRHPLFLPVVLALCLLAVAVLIGVGAWQYRQIKRKNGFIIRYLYMYLGLKYKDNPSLHPKIPERGLSQFEIIETMHLLKKMLCACFLFMAVIPMSAQEGDTQDTGGRRCGPLRGRPLQLRAFIRSTGGLGPGEPKRAGLLRGLLAWRGWPPLRGIRGRNGRVALRRPEKRYVHPALRLAVECQPARLLPED